MKEKQTRSQGEDRISEINIGVVGHIDHGKTTLLSKLTGKFADTHSEELKRGITIKLGYAEIKIYNENGKYVTEKELKNPNSKDNKPLRYVSFIDAPGHEMLMATMLSGAAVIDAAILVIAANEGIKPQTKEHLMALQAKNIKNIIIIQNKIDLVSKEQAIESYKTIKKFVENTIAKNAPIIPVSAQQNINIDKILEAIAKLDIPEKDIDSPPLFLVARSFDINRPGTSVSDLKGGVLGGILKKGKLKVGDEIEIKPGLTIKKANQVSYEPIITKILAIHKGEESIQEVFPGASISIETELDPFLAKADSLNGCIASLKGSLPEISYEMKLKLELFEEVYGVEEEKKVEQVKPGEMLMLNINTTTSVGKVQRVKGNEAEIILSIPSVLIEGDKVGIARNISGHWRLIGWGEII